MVVVGCATTSTTTDESLSSKYQKICLDSSGKGRIEFLVNKYPFTYESQINLKKNTFDLAFDFPIVGERQMSISLNPKEAAKLLNHSSVVRMLESSIEDRADRENIINAVHEFYVLTSEFVSLKSKNQFSNVYSIEDKNQHFVISRNHGGFVYEIDAYSPNEKFYERVVMKISDPKYRQNGPILSLFLVPEACEK